MKQEIMEKLLNDRELSTSEIVYIGKNLDNKTWKELPYNHEAKTSMQACGLSEGDIKELNSLFRDIMKDGTIKSTSEIVEKVEKVVSSDEKFMRMMIFQALQYSHEKASMSAGMGDVLKRLLGGEDIQGNKE